MGDSGEYICVVEANGKQWAKVKTTLTVNDDIYQGNLVSFSIDIIDFFHHY